jgi:predicted DNA-binding transcriptional regulator AlpA
VLLLSAFLSRGWEEVKKMKNSKRELLLAALLSCATTREAAVKVGMSETAVYTWLKKEDFNAELERRRSELVTDTKNYLQSRLRETTDVVFTIMNDATAPQQTRLNAASEAFRNTLKLIETSDILARLDALEAITNIENRRKL